MKYTIDTILVAALLLLNTPAFALPQPVSEIQPASEPIDARDNGAFEDIRDLWKRKGGGGGGSKGGGSSSSGSSGSSGSSSSGSSSKGGSSGYV